MWEGGGVHQLGYAKTWRRHDQDPPLQISAPAAEEPSLVFAACVTQKMRDFSECYLESTPASL